MQFRLSLSLALAILAVAIVAGLFSFVAAYREAHELQDDVLRQVAASVRQRGFRSDIAIGDHPGADGDEESRVFLQRLGDAPPGGGRRQLPANLPDGLQSYAAGDVRFRVLVQTAPAGERWAVLQQTAFRDEIARDSALRTVLPFLALVPILLLIVALLVRKVFGPVARLAREIDERSERELHSVPAEHLPIEVRPFIVAINRLLGRVDAAMQAQRRFVADAAHELRSPLTALSLQAERLAESPLPAQTGAGLTALRRGIERARSLLEQLLAMARAQKTGDRESASVSVHAIFLRVLEDLLPLAEAKHIDLGVDHAHEARLTANELDLLTLVKNLVDNAVRYSPDGSRVDLSISTAPDGRVALQVQDNGPGIQERERVRVFDPFYRVLGSKQIGSGLGLSIVKAIADRYSAEISLDFANQEHQTGLCVTVLWPAHDVAHGTAAVAPRDEQRASGAAPART